MPQTLPRRGRPFYLYHGLPVSSEGKRRQAVEDDEERFRFQSGVANLELFLRSLWEGGVISEGTYWDFLRRVYAAKKTGELTEIARDLRDLLGGRESG